MCIKQINKHVKTIRYFFQNNYKTSFSIVKSTSFFPFPRIFRIVLVTPPMMTKENDLTLSRGQSRAAVHTWWMEVAKETLIRGDDLGDGRTAPRRGSRFVWTTKNRRHAHARGSFYPSRAVAAVLPHGGGFEDPARANAAAGGTRIKGRSWNTIGVEWKEWRGRGVFETAAF